MSTLFGDKAILKISFNICRPSFSTAVQDCDSTIQAYITHHDLLREEIVPVLFEKIYEFK